MTRKTALVLGATGGVGGETARALLAAGWDVNALTRRAPPASSDIRWVQGDAMEAEDVRSAAKGASVIVHAVNPPGYRDWERQVLPMIDNTLAAARHHGARVVLPGTIYNYGHDAFPLLREDSPQHPVTRKGEIRVELERRMEKAARDGVRSLILRCGDFFGPHTGNNWFSGGLVKPGKPLSVLPYPGAPDLPHAWAYLPDVGATMAALLAQEETLESFARYHFHGYQITGNELLAALRRVTGNASLRLGIFPWPLLALASPFVETVRELRKMRYLWQSPVELDGTRLASRLGDVPHTPLDTALARTLEALRVTAPR